MTNKKNRLLTFFISLIPGAGEMYLGFYKMGTSIMALFWGSIVIVCDVFPPALYLLPVIWFYSFFHTHNLNHLPDEEFYALEDDYLLHLNPQTIRRWCLDHRKETAFLCLLCGISILWNALDQLLYRIFGQLFTWSDRIMILLNYGSDTVPKVAAAILVIWLGWYLVHTKKEGLNTPPYLDEPDSEDSWK